MKVGAILDVASGAKGAGIAPNDRFSRTHAPPHLCFGSGLGETMRGGGDGRPGGMLRDSPVGCRLAIAAVLC